MTVEYNRVVNVNVNINDRFPTAANFGTPLLMTTDGTTDIDTDIVKTFSTLASLEDYGFAFDSAVYLAAQAMLAVRKAPRTFKVAHYDIANVPASLAAILTADADFYVMLLVDAMDASNAAALLQMNTFALTNRKLIFFDSEETTQRDDPASATSLPALLRPTTPSRMAGFYRDASGSAPAPAPVIVQEGGVLVDAIGHALYGGKRLSTIMDTKVGSTNGEPEAEHYILVPIYGDNFDPEIGDSDAQTNYHNFEGYKPFIEIVATGLPLPKTPLPLYISRRAHKTVSQSTASTFNYKERLEYADGSPVLTNDVQEGDVLQVIIRHGITIINDGGYQSSLLLAINGNSTPGSTAFLVPPGGTNVGATATGTVAGKVMDSTAAGGQDANPEMIVAILPDDWAGSPGFNLPDEELGDTIAFQWPTGLPNSGRSLLLATYVQTAPVPEGVDEDSSAPMVDARGTEVEGSHEQIRAGDIVVCKYDPDAGTWVLLDVNPHLPREEFPVGELESFPPALVLPDRVDVPPGVPTVVPVSGVTAQRYAAKATAIVSAVDYNQRGAHYTLKFKRLDGAAAAKLNGQQAQAITGFLPGIGNTSAVGGFFNTYVRTGDLSYLTEGVFTDGKFVDTTTFADWLQATMQRNVMAVYLNNRVVPYDAQGVAMLLSAVTQTLATGLLSGALTDQRTDVEGDLLPPFEVEVENTGTVPANLQAQRIAPKITFCARYSGAIHYVDIDGELKIAN